MPTDEELIRDLEAREAKIKQMGGPERIKKQHALNKLTARERIALLIDPGTFEETGMHVKHHCPHFGLDKVDIPADGVVTGFGRVDSRTVCCYAQDFTSQGGSLGEMHAWKIAKIMDLAAKMRVPIIGLLDTGGARIQEGMSSLDGYGQIFHRNTLYSGIIPQITLSMGPCAGGAVYSPALTDWILMVKGSSHMYVTGPEVVKAVMGEEVTHDELGGFAIHTTKSGVAHFAYNSDAECIEGCKQLLNYLPQSVYDKPDATYHPPTDSPDRICPELDNIIPENPRQGYDMKQVIKAIVDDGRFCEPHKHYAPNMIVGWARFNGHVAGIIANQPNYMAGVLDINASDKAARFIRFCDAFNIPLVTLIDVPGYMPGTHQESGGVIRHGAKVLFAYSEATVPKISICTHKAYGGAEISMCSRSIGADIYMAWPTAQLAVMGAEGAAAIIHRREIAHAANPQAKLEEVTEGYRQMFYNPYVAAAGGYIDKVIKARDTRQEIIAALEALLNKQEDRPWKKHGNIPL
ncbi:MAG: methylmalonyl-CoA carboxyltransferase [Dehalococcoidales bacterium]|nr:methylmalonyl-CoA carboxyltransferase [Dehalococcoidales bacterium]